MPQIHPTALVDSRARLADDVQVGPWCVIEGDVTIGPGTRLLHRVSLKGPLTIGARNMVYPNACIGFEPQDRKFDPAADGAGTVIGDDNILREGVTVHRATRDRPTTIGHRNYLMANSHVGHDDLLHNDITMANGTLLAGHVEVFDRVVLGGNAAVHQFTRVGRLAMISGVESITQDLPPFCVVYEARRIGSLNIVGLRRAGHRDSIPPLKRAFEVLMRSRLANATAVERIRTELGDDPLCRELADFVATAKRGITGYDRPPQIVDSF